MSVLSPKRLSLVFSLLAFSAVVSAQQKLGPSGPAAEATSAAGPKVPATKTITSFTQALRCMDQLFLAHGKQGIVITSAGVPDETGKVRTGTKEMVITAVAKQKLRKS